MVFRYLVIHCFLSLWAIAADTFTVATFNVENYFLTPFATRKSKPAVSRAKVAEAIVSIKPDVLALQEMGRKVALEDLRNRLSQKNLIFPHVVWLSDPDPAIHLAVLSQFPIVGHFSKTNVTYLLNRKRFRVSRGFVEIEIQVKSDYRVYTLQCSFEIYATGSACGSGRDEIGRSSNIETVGGETPEGKSCRKHSVDG